MTKNIWVISDTHFQHTNILKFTDSISGALIRPGFTSVEEMDEFMIDKWNSVVQNGDKVYHLGDVVIGKDSEAWMKKTWSRLKGKKTLILGNHDSYKLLAKGGFFSNIYESRNLGDLGVLLTHRPAHESQLWSTKRCKPILNIHGHIHQNSSPSSNHVNVSVEKINYTPVNLESLINDYSTNR